MRLYILRLTCYHKNCIHFADITDTHIISLNILQYLKFKWKPTDFSYSQYIH